MYFSLNNLRVRQRYNAWSPLNTWECIFCDEDILLQNPNNYEKQKTKINIIIFLEAYSHVALCPQIVLYI